MNELQIILAETSARLFGEHVTKEVLEAAEKASGPMICGRRSRKTA